ncbi:hypothetical protein QYM36_015339 [Artemia franciscana]|uniref:Uncharacterized protein n=1 Tax=Artemia franciscana TaxID=6661 RepID=A0AA88HER0_ARTSF|nr:hypothetical protein QYM36_015339 [Artemia franciscana]
MKNPYKGWQILGADYDATWDDVNNYETAWNDDGASDVKQDTKPSEIEERIKAVLEHFKSENPKGVPGFDIPDPIDIPDANPDVGGTNLKLSESKLYGLSQLSVKHVKVDLVAMKLEIGLSFPELLMQGRYRISSWLSSSFGPYNLTIKEATMEGSTALSVDSEGKIKVDEVFLDLKFKDFNMNFENLGFFGSIIQAIFNSLVSTIFDSAKPIIQAEISTRVQGQVNEQMRSLKITFYDSVSPVDKFFIETRNNIRDDGYDPLPLPEFYIPLFGAEEGHEYSDPLESNVLALKEGKFFGLSTIHRAGNMTVAYDEITKSITIVGGLALRKVHVDYDWDLIGPWYERFGKMALKIDDFIIGVTFIQPANVNKVSKMKDLDIRMGNIQVNSKGAWLLDYGIEFATNAAVNGLRHGILKAVQQALKFVINRKLENMDLETLILQQVNQMQSSL